jgi:galactokinase
MQEQYLLQDRLHHLDHTFRGLYGEGASLFVRSPGRVNLIGDHTDYNEGWVLPAALDLDILIAAGQRDDTLLCSATLALVDQDKTDLTTLQPHDAPVWARYVRGVAALLQESGCNLPGANLLIGGTLPPDAGLSSSAALEMGIATALLTLAGGRIDQEVLNLVRIGQRVEHEYIGVQCGIMDQLVVACGVADHALLIDCRSLKIQKVPLPDSVRLLILDSAAPRMLAGSAYNQRRRECDAALQKLQAMQPALQALRDVHPELLTEAVPHLTPIEQQRVRHVVSENRRVLQAADALRDGDVATFGQLMNASHASLRDDYAVSSQALDTLVEIAWNTPGVLGARMTGGGFGGCVVALVEAAHAENALHTIPTLYQRCTTHAGTGYLCTASDGTHLCYRTSG